MYAVNAQSVVLGMRRNHRDVAATCLVRHHKEVNCFIGTGQCEGNLLSAGALLAGLPASGGEERERGRHCGRGW